MIKLFFKFYFVIAIPLIFLFIPAVNPVYSLISHWVEDVSTREYEAIFHLLDLELEDIDENGKQEYLKSVNRHFGYQVALLPLGELKLSKRKIKRIQNGETVLQLGQLTKLYKKSEKSQGVFALDLDVSQEDEADFAVRGAVYLVNRKLADLPVEEWPYLLKKLLNETDISVEIIQKAEAPESVQESQRLLDGKAVLITHEKNLNTIYTPTPDAGLLYEIGTLDERDIWQRVEIVSRVLPASLLALGILFLAWPLYRDIRRMRMAAIAFGRGHLEKRVRLGRGSSLNPLATAFNAMAGSIQKLIVSHKDLTNAVSHELKTPLTRLRFTHEMLREEPTEEERIRYLDNVERDIDDLEEIIEELLAHARYDRPIQPGQFEEVNMQEWLTEVIKPFQESSAEVGIEFHPASEAPCMCSVEKRALARAVENLLSNGLRHAESKVLLTLDCTEKEIVFTVEDNGKGVAEADRQRLFEPFVRLDSSRHRKTGGSGLGLAICKQIIERHGGTISCDSSILGGACFTCRLVKRNYGNVSEDISPVGHSNREFAPGT